MKIALILQRVKRSLVNSAGTIVFGMEDRTVSTMQSATAEIFRLLANSPELAASVESDQSLQRRNWI